MAEQNTINSFFSGVAALKLFASQTSPSPLSPSYETKRFYDMQREFSPASAASDEEEVTTVERRNGSSRQDNGVVLETVVECNGEEQEEHF